MKILGIDPGLARTGWGIIENNSGDWKMVENYCFETESTISLESRLEKLYKFLQNAIKKTKPDEAAIESLFFNTNAKTALAVGHARGISLLSLQLHRIPIFSYSPLQVKMAITGYGRAEKNQMQQMVKTLLKLNFVPKPDDVADALCVALTHVYSRKGIKK